MNIVIPYRKDVHNGLELKFALRSIEKYLTGWNNIFIIGDKPEWLRIGHLGWEDKPGQKETNIYNKLLQSPFVEFAMLNDDHFLLKPLDFTEIKQWHNGLIQDECRRPHGGRYSKALHNTFERLPEGLYFDIHTPVVFNRNNLENLIWDKEYCLKSLYCNTFPGEQEFMEDLKIDNYVSKDYIKTLISDRLFFSTGCMHDPMVEVLNELFPDKSRFEI